MKISHRYKQHKVFIASQLHIHGLQQYQTNSLSTKKHESKCATILILFTSKISPFFLKQYREVLKIAVLMCQHLCHRLFSHESKVRNLNYHSNCAIWMIIRMTVFWTVCTPNYIAMRNLKCAIQMTVRRCFPVTHLSNHTAKSLYERLDL